MPPHDGPLSDTQRSGRIVPRVPGMIRPDTWRPSSGEEQIQFEALIHQRGQTLQATAGARSQKTPVRALRIHHRGGLQPRPASPRTAPAEPSRKCRRRAVARPPITRGGPRYDGSSRCERLLAGDHVVLQRSEVKQPARDFMSVAHVGRMLSRHRDRSVPRKSVEDQTPGRNRCGYRRQD